MKINEVEKRTGMTKKAIRFYEEQDLIHPDRAENGYREYSEEDIRDLEEIGFLRRLMVPVDDIRKLREGKISLSECMDRQIKTLDSRKQAVEHARQLCSDISSAGTELSEIRFEDYEARVAELEKGGFKVTGIEEYGKRRMKKAGLAVTVFIIFMLAVEGLIVYGWLTEGMPLALFVFISLVILFPVAGSLWALNERRKELKKGEEYEAFKY